MRFLRRWQPASTQKAADAPPPPPVESPGCGGLAAAQRYRVFSLSTLTGLELLPHPCGRRRKWFAVCRDTGIVSIHGSARKACEAADWYAFKDRQKRSK